MSKRWWRGGVIAVAASVMLTLAAPVGAQAAETSYGAPIGADVETNGILSPSQILDINVEVAATDAAAKTFDAEAAAQAGASLQGIADYAEVLSGQGWTIVGPISVELSDAAVEISSTARAACSGADGYNGYYFPWGNQFALNSCNTAKLIASAGLGTAGSGGIAAVLVAVGATGVGLPIATVVAAVLGIGAAAVATCQAWSSNGGIYLNVLGTPTVSCWGQ